jgi:hypothetical protein
VSLQAPTVAADGSVTVDASVTGGLRPAITRLRVDGQLDLFSATPGNRLRAWLSPGDHVLEAEVDDGRGVNASGIVNVAIPRDR